MAKRFVIPFATSGDKSVTPDATDPTGLVSYSTGWGADYQKADDEVGYKPVGRQEMNGIMNDVTGAIAVMQAHGFPDWVAVSGLVPPYAINAIVRYNDVNYRNTVANNSAEPGTVGSGWAVASLDDSGRLLNVQVFTNSGVYTPTAGTRSIIIEMVGGGGGGGGAKATTAGQVALGSGGGAGSFARRRLTTGFAGQTVTIGAGGTGVAGAVGNAGGTTSFGALVTAPGGAFGTSGPAGAPPQYLTATAVNAPPTGADVGGVGQGGYDNYAFTGVDISGARGGASFYGVGGDRSVNSVGGAAITPGSGGGGANVTASSVARAGGAGAPGICTIWEYS